jgi:hypothetical protein
MKGHRGRSAVMPLFVIARDDEWAVAVAGHGTSVTPRHRTGRPPRTDRIVACK